MECSFHKDKNVLLACADCNDELVCSDCLVEKHNSHRVKKLTTLAEEILKAIKEEAELIVDKHKILREKKDNIFEEIKKQEEASERSCNDIEDDKIALCSLFEKTADDLLKECRTETQKNVAVLQEQKSSVETQLASLAQFRDNFNEIVKINDPIKIIQCCKNLTSVSIDSEQAFYPCAFVYEKRKPSTEGLEKMFGTFPRKIDQDEDNASDVEGSIYIQYGNTPEPLELSEAQSSQNDTTCQYKKYLQLASTFRYDRLVTFILPSPTEKCWLLKHGDSRVVLADKEGYVHYNVKFQHQHIQGLASLQDGTLLVTSLYPNCILQVSVPDGKISTLFLTGEMEPRRLCTTSKNEILVTSEMCLKKFTKDGMELACVEYDKYKNKILLGAGRVRVNNKEDTVAVGDIISAHVKCLVLFDSDLNLRLRYLGHGRVLYGHQNLKTFTSTEKFYVNDVIFDKDDNIILCEAHSCSVQLLSPSCQLLQILLMLDRSPWCMALSKDGALWVGYNDQTVRVYT